LSLAATTGHPRPVLLAFPVKWGIAMPRTATRETSKFPALVFALAGLALGVAFVHDLVDSRLLTAASIFHSPLVAVGGALGVTMAAVLAWDLFASRHSK